MSCHFIHKYFGVTNTMLSRNSRVPKNAYRCNSIMIKIWTKQHCWETYVSGNFIKERKEIYIMRTRRVIASRHPSEVLSLTCYVLTVVIITWVFIFKITVKASVYILGDFLHMCFALQSEGQKYLYDDILWGVFGFTSDVWLIWASVAAVPMLSATVPSFALCVRAGVVSGLLAVTGTPLYLQEP